MFYAIVLSLLIFSSSPVRSYFSNYDISRSSDQEEISGSNENSAPLNKQIAAAYGIDSFSNIKSITYTFNVEFNGKKFSRKWQWNPKTNDITYWGKDSANKEITLSYNRNKPMDDATKKIDAGFINDNYWLLFPFHLVWDANVKFTDEGVKKFPFGNEKGRALMVKYSDKVGYTPGDAFELFLGKDNMIKQWIYFHKGNLSNPRPAMWQGNKNFDGVIISTLHTTPANKFKLWFSDVKVTE